ncbi:hypothetical protein AFK68_29600 [Hydrocoleum sp. CS-953]|uniref:hypothetical protein n=1 Tax=Hydrocoleum sp. CS-953 TaxID=1671698 RepID=UPI000B9B5D9A|nr:hypothetical protein [Hydrocoleum sp. CS-953]OZH51648.1 hypothetical protein AFK68_29600 [Hydrocoleum sp. CS-953]
MLKYIIIGLITLELVLLSGFFRSPANATIRDSEIFTWDYASISNSQVVCKKVKFHPINRRLPESSDMEPVNINSQVVNDSYCADLTKPV